MNRDQTDGASRRNAIQRGLGAIAGAALLGVARTGAWGAEKKLAKSAVKYVEVGTDEGKDCDDCMQFVPGKTAQDSGTCKIVEGEISPHGHCIAFSPKPKK
jgi:High potential iron-sulfur protein